MLKKNNIKTFTQLKACFFKNEQGLNFIIKKSNSAMTLLFI